MHKFVELSMLQRCIFTPVHVNVACCRLLNQPKTPLRYWLKRATVRHSLCCLPAGVHREKLNATEKAAGSLTEIRHRENTSAPLQHKADTLDSVELGPRCAQPCYDSFGDGGGGERRQETKDGDELRCHDDLQRLFVLLVSVLREKFTASLETCAW